MAAGSTPDKTTRNAAKRRELFPAVADALRKLAHDSGFSIHVSTNTLSITLTEKGYVGGDERDVHIKLREKPRA